jgi:hypothetical protein
VTRRTARALLAVLLLAGVAVAPTLAIAEFRAANDCASHCARTRGDDGCPPRCCIVGPETSSLATLSSAAHVERPAVAPAAVLAPAAFTAPIVADRVTRLDGRRGAGPPVWLTVLSLRL